jgi:putative ABC transport system permease protein
MRTFVRLFAKRKAYYITNILGLTVGLAAAGFSILYFQHELSYDSFHSKADKIYRVSNQHDEGWFAALNIKYIQALRQDTIPEIEEQTRIRRWYSKFVFVEDRKFYESKVMLTDPGSAFFSMFDFPFKEGVAKTALEEPNSVVINSTLAKKYFGDRPALGETIMYDTMGLTVTGVFEDLPTNTAFTFELLITNQAAMDEASGSYTFVILKENTDREKLEQKILQANVGELHQRVTDVKIIPLKDLHFEGNFIYEMKTVGNRSYLWILGAIGGTILLIAFTNFINLSVALYARRSREIAVRKSVGASSALLSKQFYFESFVTISFAFLLAMTLLYGTMPWFNSLMELRLPNPLTSLPFLVGMGVVLPVMTIISGAYPALILPRIHILDLFKQTGITTHHGMTLRMFLLGFQLIVLFFVCCSLWIIQGQFNFMRNKDLGFSKEGVVKIRRAWMLDSARYQTLKIELKQHPAIEVVSEGFAPGDEDYGYTFRGEGTEIMDGMLSLGTDYDYLSVLNIRPLEGPIATGDIRKLPGRTRVINETLAKMLGYDDPIGKKLIINPGQKNERVVTIDGVVADYHFNSLHHPVAPQMLSLNQVSTSVEENVLVKVNTQNLVDAVEFIQKKLDALVPDIPVEISFLEADIEKLYKQEARLGKVVTILVTASLILSVVGLVALCSYMIEFRQREIAIRKVLGAATAGIVSLFTKVFVKTTLVAFVIGAPLCYWAMDKWMEAFAYREEISLSWFVFVLIGVLVITIGLAVAQTVKAAQMNPTAVLKE